MAEDNLKHTITVEDGLIFILATDVPSTEDLKVIFGNAKKILTNSKKPMNALVHVSSAHPSGIDSFQTAVEYLQKLPIKRLAIFGDNPNRLLASRKLLKLAGENDRFKLFRSEEDARAWLAKSS